MKPFEAVLLGASIANQNTTLPHLSPPSPQQLHGMQNPGGVQRVKLPKATRTSRFRNSKMVMFLEYLYLCSWREDNQIRGIVHLTDFNFVKQNKHCKTNL